jgi:hypothetical protein
MRFGDLLVLFVLRLAVSMKLPSASQRFSGNRPEHRRQPAQEYDAGGGSHIWDLITHVEEVMRGLDDLVQAGKTFGLVPGSRLVGVEMANANGGRVA